jgi:hypothetical protein
MYTWQKDICASSDSRSKRILDLVYSEEVQELEAAVVMSPTIYDNLELNGTVALKTPGSVEFSLCLAHVHVVYFNLACT